MDHVVGMKDSSADLPTLEELIAIARQRPGFGIGQGSETQLVAGLRLGSDGVVPGTANVAPRLAVALVDAFRRGDVDEAERLQQLADQLVTIHRVRPGVPAVKAILSARGLCPANVAAPFVECSEEERRELLETVAPLEPWLITTDHR